MLKLYLSSVVVIKSNMTNVQKYTYFRLWSTGSFMSFCILTLIMSPGVPTIPPQPPAKAAIPSRTGNGIGSPFGDTFCFATYTK